MEVAANVGRQMDVAEAYCVVIGACTLVPFGLSARPWHIVPPFRTSQRENQQRGRRVTFRPTASRKGCSLSLFTTSDTSQFFYLTCSIRTEKLSAHSGHVITTLQRSPVSHQSFLLQSRSVYRATRMYMTSTNLSSQARKRRVIPRSRPIMQQPTSLP